MKGFIEFTQKYPMVWKILWLIIFSIIMFFVVRLLLKVEKKLFNKLLATKKNINLRYLEGFVRFIIIFFGFEIVIMDSELTQSFGRTLFQGTTIVAAIGGFAAQPVIADMICGLMMSVTRPFNIGDRIELDNGQAGIVKDISLRHVVLQGIDTVQIIIPNSKLNSMVITNMTHQARRSIHFRFNVAYPTDVDKAKEVIARAVRESAYTVPGYPGKGGDTYGPVYFIAFADSSLVMATTVYYEATSATEAVKNDINSRVKKALEAANIEIPYNYVSVVLNDGTKDD